MVHADAAVPAPASRSADRSEAALSKTSARICDDSRLPSRKNDRETTARAEKYPEIDSVTPCYPGGINPDTFSRLRTTSAAEVRDTSAAAPLFLSLILLVLAFFIVMVSISRPDAERSARVINSIAGVFAHESRSGAGAVPEGAQRGDVVDGEDFEQSLKRLFATELSIAEFKSVVPGRLLEVTLAGDDLFYRQEARLRPTATRLLDRLVAATTLRPKGPRVTVRSLISSPTSLDGNLLVAPPALALQRAAALGERLVRRGLPRAQLAVGIWPDQHDRIVLVFSLAVAEGSPGTSSVVAGTAFAQP